jgi:hypothetical protein
MDGAGVAAADAAAEVGADGPLLVLGAAQAEARSVRRMRRSAGRRGVMVMPFPLHTRVVTSRIGWST